MRSMAWIGLVLLLLPGCGGGNWDATLSRSQVDALLTTVVRAPLPSGATQVYGRKASVMTTTVDVRFTCTSQELTQFLASSSVLPNSLVTGKRTVLDSMCGATWWKPDELVGVSGAKDGWKLGADVASGLVMAGKEQGSDKVVLYLSVTLE